MKLQCTVLREWKDKPYKSKSGEQIVPHVLTMTEMGSAPLLQLIDYTLLPEELEKFGTLQGKALVLEVREIRSIFSGRPRMAGQIVWNNGDTSKK